MARPSINTSLASELGFPRSLSRAILEVYAFGSFARGNRTSDVDLLIVWDPSEATPLEAQELRRVFREQLKVVLPLDIVLLTAREAINSAFVETERAELIYRRSDYGRPTPQASRSRPCCAVCSRFGTRRA